MREGRGRKTNIFIFNNAPGVFFPQTQIDVVHFPEGPGADSFSEKIFTGPVHIMLQEALAHIRNQVIAEKIIKHPDRPEADRFLNYSFVAIENARSFRIKARRTL